MKIQTSAFKEGDVIALLSQDNEVGYYLLLDDCKSVVSLKTDGEPIDIEFFNILNTNVDYLDIRRNGSSLVLKGTEDK